MSFFGKQFSIIGDSISTLQGYLPPFCKAFYMHNPHAIRSGISRPRDTWWAPVLQHFGGTLCVNNSYSGSLVCGYAFPAATHSLRCGELHATAGSYSYRFDASGNKRILCACDTKPDVILVALGTNDWIFRSPIGTMEKDKTYFDYAYGHLLRKLQRNYPDARIFCATLFQRPDAVQYPLHHISDYNQVIRHMAAAHHCGLVELANLEEVPETIDGIHPTYQGMHTLSKIWLEQLVSQP